MAIGKPITTWTCDRCGRGESMPDREQPKGWLAVYLVSPPLRSVQDDRVAWLLCPACDKSLAAWRRAALAGEGE